MKYNVHSRLNAFAPMPLGNTELTGYPIEWYVCDELGRWVHADPFLTKEMAEEFLKGFLAWPAPLLTEPSVL